MKKKKKNSKKKDLIELIDDIAVKIEAMEIVLKETKQELRKILRKKQ